MSNPIARVWVQALPDGPMFPIDVGDAPVHIGSSPRAHVRVNHATVAHTHASLRLDPEGYVVVYDHTDGETLLDGRQFEDVAALALGSVVSLGGALRFRIAGVDIPRELRPRRSVASEAA